jgi:hypothetical protein
LLGLAPSSSLAAEIPLLQLSTPKSAIDFTECFASVQTAQAKPLAFVPFETGGGWISNEGANGVINPYRIRVLDAGAGTEVRALIYRRDGTEDLRIVEAIQGCS